MIKRISSEYLLLPNHKLVKNHTLSFESSKGIIISIQEGIKKDSNYQGEGSLIVPGFVNTHTHLELAYLKNRVKKNTFLPGFLKEMIDKRELTNNKQKKILDADLLMYQNGISLVGDIMNSSKSLDVKKTSKIKYINFIEIFGLDASQNNQKILESKRLKKQISRGENVNIVPHAFYSTNKQLINYILSLRSNKVISIHYKESLYEKDFFDFQKGKLYNLMQHFYKYLTFNDTINKIKELEEQISSDILKIFVHNTFITNYEIAFITSKSKSNFFCFCPKANLYIENTLPNFSLFKKHVSNCVIGTDSLASNDTLDLLEEIKIIEKLNFFSFYELIDMITINGAKALGMENNFGKIKIGTSPGINCLKNFNVNSKAGYFGRSKLKRIV